MSRFNAILWDVDGTLLDFLYAQRISISKTLEGIGVIPTDEMVERYSAINDRCWKLLELGLMTRDELQDRRFVDFFEEYGIENVDVKAFRETYLSHLSEIYRYVENSYELCAMLKGRIKQYVITNGVTAVQNKKLALSGLYELMDGVFISDEVGAAKPSRDYFDYCLERIGESDPKRLLIVGDSLTSDIKGGVLSGIPTCWFRPANIFETDENAEAVYNEFHPDYEIEHLSQVLDIIGLED